MASTGLFNHVGTVHRVMTKANEEIKSNTQIIEAIATKVIQEKVGNPLDKLIETMEAIES